MAIWKAPRGSARQVGLVRDLQVLSNCGGGISKRGNTLAAGFRVPKFRHTLACRATASSGMVKWIAPGDPACRVCLVRCFQGLSGRSGGISKVENTPVAGISIPKFRYILGCRAPASGCMAKWMVLGDLAHRVCPLRYFQGCLTVVVAY